MASINYLSICLSFEQLIIVKVLAMIFIWVQTAVMRNNKNVKNCFQGTFFVFLSSFGAFNGVEKLSVFVYLRRR